MGVLARAMEWTEEEERREPREEREMQRRDGYAMGHSFNSCSFFQIMQLEKHLCSCTPRVALRHERPSMCVLQPTRGADPGTSLFRLSPFPSLPFLLIIGWRPLECLNKTSKTNIIDHAERISKSEAARHRNPINAY